MACRSGTGGAPVAASDVDPPGARLLGASAVWAGTLAAVEGLRIGSISALAYDGPTRRWIGAIDDIATPRLVWLDIPLEPVLAAKAVAITRITAAPDLPADVLTALDMEGLARLPDGGFAISHEGHIDRQGIARQPRVLVATAAGVVTSVVRPRDRFAIDPADRSHGVRHNLGLESLTRTPDGRLLSGIEQPLLQDGPVTTRDRGGVVRLLEFVPTPAGGWRPGREWAYALEPTPVVAGYDAPCEDGENGLSDLLAVTDSVLLAVERACLVGAPGAPAFNPVRLFEVALTEAEDVSDVESLAGRTPRPARKRLVADLMAWRMRLPSLLATLSNFEGLAFGPSGPGGHPTVMLVSDDNFRPTQTTAFVWLALRGPMP
jgi:hypothetical protein